MTRRPTNWRTPLSSGLPSLFSIALEILSSSSLSLAIALTRAGMVLSRKPGRVEGCVRRSVQPVLGARQRGGR